MADNKINVGGRLHSIATGNTLAGADEILDDNKSKKQSEINADVDNALADRYTKDETYNKNELNSLITTPDVQYVTVNATEQTTAVTDILPSTGAANTIYRVGKWDGTQYNTVVYSEYAWDSNAYVLLDVKEYGIDDEPTAESDNLVKSGGVERKIRRELDNYNKVDGKVFYIADSQGFIIAKVDKDGVHSVDFRYGQEDTSLIGAIENEIEAREEGDVEVTALVEAEEARAKDVENTKLNHTIEDDTFLITDSQGFIIAKVDNKGIHAPNLFEGKFDDDKLLIMDNDGYIIAKVDKDGVHSAKNKHAVACMVLSEAYYPIAAPIRDDNGNVTYAEVMFESGIEGSISITYTNGNSSSVAVIYGNYNYTITINRDEDGNVETVSVN